MSTDPAQSFDDEFDDDHQQPDDDAEPQGSKQENKGDRSYWEDLFDDEDEYSRARARKKLKRHPKSRRRRDEWE